MKTWTIPVAAAQQFAANEYVSACTATINCDLELADGYLAYDIEFGKTLETAIGPRTWVSYKPCGKTHDVSSHGELLEITIHDGTAMVDGVKTKNHPLETAITCYFWAEYDEANVMQDGHCTLNADGFQSNKS